MLKISELSQYPKERKIIQADKKASTTTYIITNAAGNEREGKD